MSKSAHTEAQIIGAVKQVEAGRKADEVAREMGVSKHTIYAWKQKYGGLEVAEAQELKALRDENTRLKKLVANLSLDKDALQHVITKKRIQLVGPKAQLRQRRADVEAIRALLPMSQRQACKLAEVAVSSYRYRSRTAGRDNVLRDRLQRLAHQYPQFGSPRLFVLLRRAAPYNHKLVERHYRELGLALRRKKRKRLTRAGVPFPPAERANQEWAMDFVSDAVGSGRHVRILTVVDVFTRECLALETDTSMGSLRVVRVLDRIIAERGAPQRIRSDNGPEFTSRAYLAWSLDQRIELVHIRPGKPIENAYIESFNGRLREECLSASWFRNLFDARRQIETWRGHYNTVRPHSSLGYRTPEEFAALRAADQSSAGVREGASNAGPFPHTPNPG